MVFLHHLIAFKDPRETVVFLTAIGLLAFFVFARFVEPVYVYLFRKPFYVHFYPLPKKLPLSQKSILQSEFQFYQRLPENHKIFFEHRVARFIETYQFIGKEGLLVNDQMKVIIAATSTMLTFGMRNYLYRVFDKIIIFPSSYLSTISGELHNGEFNPRVKALVFSWEHFLKGYEISSDNLNLGIHEFTHALHFQGRKSTDASAAVFNRMHALIVKDVNHPPNRKRLIDSEFFRIYAYTNEFEFLAVILEHFFESPKAFRREFPELYDKVRVMINFREFST